MSKFYPKKDKDAWESYPHLRSYFNKLDLSLKLEYVAGPSGTPVPHDGEYIIRPIYNLSGLSANTQIVTLKEGETINDPSLFWCEKFDGDHLTIDYSTHRNEIYPQRCFHGHKNDQNIHYSSWTRVDVKELPQLEIPPFIVKDLHSLFKFNIEWVGDKIIEIHLHHNEWFPQDAEEIIPIWDDGENAMSSHLTLADAGYTFKESVYDAHGQSESKRLGFYWR